jgi:hypothetical protein
MSNVTNAAVCISLAASLAWFAGCRKEPPAAPPPANPPAPAADPAKQPAADAGAASKIEASFASLSAEDRARATTQKICPVSGEGLGTMGTPIKVSVAGQEVFICCESCKDPLLEKPAEHLAKIGLKPSAETAPQ